MFSFASLDPYGLLPSRKEVKQTRREWCSTSFCKKCRAKEGIKQCSKCKVVYCSPECQKEDWPEHKGFCSLYVKGNPDVTKLCQTLMANMLLRRYIEVLIILKLDLLQKTDPEQPFRAQIIIGFEPASIDDFFTLFKSSAVIDANPLEGMMQIHQILPEDVDFGGLSKTAAFPKSELDKRRIVSHSAGLGALQFGFIQFIYGSGKSDRSGEKLIITCMDMLLQEESMDFARQANELEIPLDFEAGTTVKKPLSEWTCIELVNALIRRDTKNKWLLRINMEQMHKQIIKDASVPWLGNSVPIVSPPTDTSPNVFTESIGPKMMHESVYIKYTQAFLSDHTSV